MSSSLSVPEFDACGDFEKGEEGNKSPARANESGPPSKPQLTFVAVSSERLLPTGELMVVCIFEFASSPITCPIEPLSLRAPPSPRKVMAGSGVEQLVASVPVINARLVMSLLLFDKRARLSKAACLFCWIR